MRLSHGENKNDWPAFDVNVWYTSAVDDRNAHGDNYGLGALGKKTFLETYNLFLNL